MKRFVVFALVVAMTTGAYAGSPTVITTTVSLTGKMVYDFSASVKNTNLKIIKVRAPSPVITTTVKSKAKPRMMDVAVKYVQTTSLYGYIVDAGDSFWAKVEPQDDGPNGQIWAVIANRNYQRPAIGHLFEVTPVQVNIFDPAGKELGMPLFGKSKGGIQDYQYIFGAEGGLLMTQGEDCEGDNVLILPDDVEDKYRTEPVNRYSRYAGAGLFGPFDYMGNAWFAAAGFGTAKLTMGHERSGQPYIDFDMNLTGSIIGGWLDVIGRPWLPYYQPYPYATSFDMPLIPIPDLMVCGMLFAEIMQSESFFMTSWIAGTWSIKKNEVLKPVTIYDGGDKSKKDSYGPCFVAGALEAINKNQILDDLEDYDQYP